MEVDPKTPVGAGVNNDQTVQQVESYKTDFRELAREIGSVVQAQSNLQGVNTVKACVVLNRSSYPQVSAYDLDTIYFFPNISVGLVTRHSRNMAENTPVAAMASLVELNAVQSNEGIEQPLQIPVELANRIRALYDRKMQILADHPQVTADALNITSVINQ